MTTHGQAWEDAFRGHLNAPPEVFDLSVLSAAELRMLSALLGKVRHEELNERQLAGLDYCNAESSGRKRTLSAREATRQNPTLSAREAEPGAPVTNVTLSACAREDSGQIRRAPREAYGPEWDTTAHSTRATGDKR